VREGFQRAAGGRARDGLDLEVAVDEHPDDRDILERIDELTKREHELDARSVEDDGLSAEDEMVLRELVIERDQQWDLLRQRRARRDAGLDPAGATLRDPRTVEGYEQ
jgi:hypothetical protein